VIARHLTGRAIPFIDVGIGVDKVTESVQLLGRARVTLIESDTAHLVDKLPIADDQDDAVYNNVQVVELNAMNAMLAVVRYKQLLGFYADETKAMSLKYISSWSRLVVQARGDAESPTHQA
jgi:hypothetical protein